jgi:septal ring factor EnvC (AmiA/AmiB activator)
MIGTRIFVIVSVGCMLLIGQNQVALAEKHHESTDKKAIESPKDEKRKSEESGGEIEKYRKSLEQELKALDKKIGALENKVKHQEAKMKEEAKESWNDLKAKQNEAKGHLKSIASAGKDTWEKAKTEADSALESLRKAYDKAASYFK